MTLWSIAFAYRLGLGFHALNNEGSDGGNLMQPRRIDVRTAVYDGISGEIIRRHILANFVENCRAAQVSMLPLSEGLHPDRGPLGIRHAARTMGQNQLDMTNLYATVRRAVEECAVLDVGGYLAAWREQPQNYTAESAYIAANCAQPVTQGANAVQPIKRDSCFDVAWLVSEAPQDVAITQHSAFRDTFDLNSRYAQTMRTNVYGGAVRADLHRIGTDDYWYLQPGTPRLTISEAEQLTRQKALIDAIANFIAAPTGAKMAGWAPHCFLVQGAILLCSSRAAPFASPIRLDLEDESDTPVKANSEFRSAMTALANQADTWCWEFDDAKSLRDAATKAAEQIARPPIGSDRPA